MAFAPTSEQVDIVDAALDRYDVIVTAGAGTGKSTTMRLLAESMPDKEFLYLAFNKSVAVEAQRKMPRNVKSSTAHSLAYGWAKNDRDVAPLMNKMNDRRWVKESDLIKLMFPGGAEFVEVPGVLASAPKIIGPGQQARIALAAMRQFCQSGDTEISFKHLRRPDTLLQPAWESLKEQVGDQIIAGARRAWADVTSVRGEVIQFTHDIYLKLYSLSEPDLSRRYDVIILDEAQDANPVIASIIMHQMDYCQLVLVGDESQSIYCQPAGTKVSVPNFPDAPSLFERCGGPLCVNKASYGKTGFCFTHARQSLAGERLTVLPRSTQAVESKQVNIEDLKIGDRVVTFDNSHVFSHGRPIRSIERVPYSGELIRVHTEDGLSSAYTPNHHVYLRMGGAEFRSKHIVYLMRKGDHFRIGRVPLAYSSQGGSFGLGLRSSQEGAEAAWILSAHDTIEQAALAEVLAIQEYNIPGVRFKPTSDKDVLKVGDFWSRLGSLESNANRCLSDHGRLIEFPIWTSGYQNVVGIRRPVISAAANFMDGMEVAPLNNRKLYAKRASKRQVSADTITSKEWVTAKVTREYYDGDIVSINVADHHNYFADGILTHNSFTGATNAMGKFRKIATARDEKDRAEGLDVQERVKLLPLQESFRFGEDIACAANRVLTVLSAPLRITGRGEEGQVLDGPGYEMGPKSLREVDAVLVRTNAGGIEVALRAIAEGLRPKLAADVSDIISFVKAAKKLQAGQRTTHADLQFFANWAEFIKVVEDDDHAKSEFGVRVKLVDKYGTDRLLALLEQLKSASETNYDLLITTSHKAKGGEWGTVLIGNDFESAPSADEQMLAYVAITRAKTTLYSGPLWPLTRWGLLPDAGDTEGSLKLDDAACAAFGYLGDEQANALVGDILRYLGVQMDKVMAPDFDPEQQQNYVREMIERMAMGYRRRYPDRVPQEELSVRMGVAPLIPAMVDYRKVMDLSDIPSVAYPLTEGQESQTGSLAQISADEAAGWMVARALSDSGEQLATVEDFLSSPQVRKVIYRIAQAKASEEGQMALTQFDRLKDVVEANT